MPEQVQGALLILNGADWQSAHDVGVPDKITVLPLAARAPKFDPIKNVWQFLCDKRLGNHVIVSYDNICGQCCRACNQPADRP